jgi:ribosome-associated toxin RatA of RatAB toxin-antitoxin module
MAIHGKATTTIDAPIGAVFALAADVEGSPAWQPEIRSAEVLQRDGEGRQVLVRTVTSGGVRDLHADLEFSYEEPHAIRWRQARGDLKSIDGSWTFESIGEGSTQATYEMTVDLGRVLGTLIRGPLVSILRHRIVETMPGKLAAHLQAHG